MQQQPDVLSRLCWIADLFTVMGSYLSPRGEILPVNRSIFVASIQTHYERDRELVVAFCTKQWRLWQKRAFLSECKQNPERWVDDAYYYFSMSRSHPDNVLDLLVSEEDRKFALACYSSSGFLSPAAISRSRSSDDLLMSINERYGQLTLETDDGFDYKPHLKALQLLVQNAGHQFDQNFRLLRIPLHWAAFLQFQCHFKNDLCPHLVTFHASEMVLRRCQFALLPTIDKLLHSVGGRQLFVQGARTWTFFAEDGFFSTTAAIDSRIPPGIGVEIWWNKAWWPLREVPFAD